MNIKQNAKEQVEKLRKLFFELEQPVEAKDDAMNFAEYKLNDGTPVMIDKLEIGGIVTLNDAPVADGEYTLEDGTIITILDGLIAELASPAEEAEVEEVEAKDAEQPAMMSKEDFEDFKKFIESKFAKQEQANQKNIEVLEQIMSFEVEKPLQQNAVDFESLTPLQKFRLTK